jgi:predicted kinase
MPAAPSDRSVIMLCGLPASGKTTTAGRLHAVAGGALIRSCDVFRALGISLPEWVRRTRGFTVDVAEYDRVRDQAYREMERRLDERLRAGSRLVIVDAVHGEADKRQAVYETCRARGAAPVLVWCRCADPAEIARRFEIRRGRAAEPENEASDLSVFRDIERRWTDPSADRLADGSPLPIVTYDTRDGALALASGADSPLIHLIRSALEGSAAIPAPR